MADTAPAAEAKNDEGKLGSASDGWSDSAAPFRALGLCVPVAVRITSKRTHVPDDASA